MKHYLLSILIVMLPIMASADESGTFCENLKWTYEEATGTLTISGNGPMNDCHWYNVLTGSGYYVRPWPNSSSIQKVVIEEGVTSIGRGYFWQCTQLTSVTIPNSVTSIGGSAFYGCYGLTSITIPNSVTSIGEWAFGDCTGLTSVTIPNSVTDMGSSAFSGCIGLSKVEFHCESIGNWFSGLTSLKEIIIGSEVTSIGKKAFFGCSSLNSLTIPNSVTSIEESAFEGCSSLTSLTIPSSVTSISNSAFSGCIGLTSVIVLCSPTYIGSPYSASPFSNCPNIKEVSFDCEYVTSLFKGCSSIKNVNFSENVTSIGESAFSGCRGLTSALIPNNVVSIGSYAFSGCYSLSSITIPSSMTSIAEGIFTGCSGLLSITIPNSVTSIGKEAFSGCSTLVSVIIGNGVTSIGEDAFSSTNIRKAIWLTNTPPSGYKYVKGTVNYVSNDQFSSLSNTVKYQFLSSYFDVDGIRYVPVSPSERTCDAIDCVYDESAKDTKIASTVAYKGVTMTVKNINSYLAYGNKYIETLSVDTEGILASYAFADCSNLKSVIYGHKVTNLGDHVFSGCSSLTSVKTTDNIPQDNVLYFSKSINSVEDFAVSGCSEIKNVIIADSGTELKIGSNGNSPLFSSCPLDYVYIGRNINYGTNSKYGYSPFYRNTTLREVKITDKETEISENEFYGCTSLQSITIGDGVTTIGNRAFSGCQSLKFFAFGSQVATIGQEAFSDCSAITEIISKAKTAPICGDQALNDINKWDCKLYVPDGCMATYEAADQWKDFLFKEEGEGSAGQNPDQNKDKCETPTIKIEGDKLTFTCKTNGVIFHYSITHSDVKTDISNGEVMLTNTYEISVYASKEGYKDSDVAREEIQVKNGLYGDLNGDGKVDVSDHVELTNIIMGQ